MPGPERMLRKREVAWRLNVSKSTVHRLMKEGLPFRRLHGSVRFVWGEVREWVSKKDEGRRQKAEGGAPHLASGHLLPSAEKAARTE
jgi:excisionase family DNA binding protein